MLVKSKEQVEKEVREIALEISMNLPKPYVSILQPRRNLKETPAQNLMHWQNRMINVTSIAVSYHCTDGLPVDLARCILMEKALEDGSKYAFFVDEDTVVPWDGLMRLMDTSKKYPDAIIVGIYYVKFGNVMISVLDEEGRWTIPDVTPNTGVIRNVMSAGLGCALIPTHIVREIKRRYVDIPLFCIVPEKAWGDENITFIGEDTWFYHLVRKCGFEVIADTSVQCLHMDLSTGKYTAHPDVDLSEYVTLIPITERLTLKDRLRVSKEYVERLCSIDWEQVLNQKMEESEGGE